MVRFGDSDSGERAPEKPAWLDRLMSETFFAACSVHLSRRKNEKNIFCLLCRLSFCPHCLPSHRSHPLLQVRRYVYHDVVRLLDLQKLIDCNFIQPYTINGAKVIFLKQRTQSASASSASASRGWKAGAAPNVCLTCDRVLQPSFHFCSLSCKVDHMVGQGEAMTSIWMSSPSSHSDLQSLRPDNSDMIVDDDDDEPIMASEPNPQLPEPRYSSYDHGDSSSSGARKKKSSSSNNSSNNGTRSRFLSAFSLASRRKGAPHRAPLS